LVHEELRATKRFFTEEEIKEYPYNMCLAIRLIFLESRCEAMPFEGQTFIQKKNTKKIEAMLKSILNERDYKTLLLHYKEGKRYIDISRMLDINAGTCSQATSRAFHRLHRASKNNHLFERLEYGDEAVEKRLSDMKKEQKEAAIALENAKRKILEKKSWAGLSFYDFDLAWLDSIPVCCTDSVVLKNETGNFPYTIYKELLDRGISDIGKFLDAVIANPQEWKKYARYLIERGIVTEQANEFWPIKTPLSLISIDYLPMHAITKSALRCAGCTTVGKLVRKTEDEVWKTNNIGQKGLAAITKSLREKGLSLKKV